MTFSTTHPAVSSSLLARFVDDLAKPSSYIDRKYEVPTR